MMKVTRNRWQKQRRGKRIITMLSLLLVLFFCCIFLLSLRNNTVIKRISYQLCCLMINQISPTLFLSSSFEIREDEEAEIEYVTRRESGLIYDRILASNVGDERSEVKDVDVDSGENGSYGTANINGTAAVSTINLNKLNDFDYLTQKLYTVDRTTTINSSLLNAEKLLAYDCQLEPRQDNEPQILIYHTHGSEGYADSTEGDPNTTVIGVGEYLAQILRDTYGYQVLHDTGIYDSDRDRAYSVAAPYVEQILADHPSIEVIIDLHRDAVPETTRLVAEQNGVSMAQIMFFNGLSRTTAMGEITYLPNAYIEDNLAFSLQMKLKAMELYPDFTRRIYLKGYRYNMHFRPKSLLIEVGAQNNTLQEAMNAMAPLANILNQVLRP